MMIGSKEFKLDFKGLVNSGLIIAFLSHGVLFFTLGEGINYHEATWVKYIKYILVLIYLWLNWKSLTQGRFLSVVFVLLAFFSLQFIRSVYTGEDPESQLFLNYYMAILLVLVRPPNLKGKYAAILNTVFFFSVVLAVGEYFLFKDRISNNDFSSVYGYYRVGSCFMSPNTCGGMMNLFCCFFLRPIARDESVLKNIFMIILAGCVVLMTGSRAALIAFVVLIIPIMLYNLRIKKALKIFFPLGMLIVALFASHRMLSEVENLPVDRQDAGVSTDWRLNQVTDFFASIKKDVVFPISEEGHRVDCGWIQMYYDYGFLGVFLALSFFFLYFIRTNDFYIKLAIFMIFIFSITQVAMYLHPYAYLFTYLVSYIEEKSSGHEKDLESG